MKKNLLIFIGMLGLGLIIFFSQKEIINPHKVDGVEQKSSLTPSGEQREASTTVIKISSPEEFSNELKLSEQEKKFLTSFSDSEYDLVIAQAVLLSLHDPKSPQVSELQKIVFLNPQSSIKSIAKFINSDDLPGAELQKSALLSLGSEIALDENSKRTLHEASTAELYKIANALPDLPSGTPTLVGPEAELNFIQSLKKEDANKLASAVSYFKNASAGADGIVEHKDVVNVLKEIDNPIIKNFLARDYFESNRDKLSSEDLAELKEVGVNYDGYSKSAQ